MRYIKSSALIHSAARKSHQLITIAAVALAAIASLSSVSFAEAGEGNPHCTEVGGAFVTNFTAEDQTAGTATGDLKGAVGVKILETVSKSPLVLKVQHFWVTETGDTLLLDPAEVTAYPSASPSQTGLFSFVYEDGVKITGGTGKYAGAT